MSVGRRAIFAASAGIGVGGSPADARDTVGSQRADDPADRRGLVARILSSSAVDGPGNRAIVFLQGCDFDCRYCHNPETRAACIHCGACVPACPSGALSLGCDESSLDTSGGRKVRWDPTRCTGCGACIAACAHDSSPKAVDMSVAEVLATIGRYRPFLRGVTVSGGECGLQSAFLEALLLGARSMGLDGLVDTNGSTDYARLPGLVDAAFGFMLDVKAWDEGEHRRLTGASNRMVLENLRFLASAAKLYEVRTVVTPGLFDAEATVRETSRTLVSAGSSARYKIIRFRPQGVRAAWRDIPVPDDATMDRLAAVARENGIREVVVV